MSGQPNVAVGCCSPADTACGLATPVAAATEEAGGGFGCAGHVVGFLHHTSWEVDDVDEIARGARSLLENHPERHVWGLGRHWVGANSFYYFRDPSGHSSEYFFSTWTGSPRTRPGSPKCTARRSGASSGQRAHRAFTHLARRPCRTDGRRALSQPLHFDPQE